MWRRVVCFYGKSILNFSVIGFYKFSGCGIFCGIDFILMFYWYGGMLFVVKNVIGRYIFYYFKWFLINLCCKGYLKVF